MTQTSWNGPICPVCDERYLGSHECKGHQCEATREVERLRDRDLAHLRSEADWLWRRVFLALPDTPSPLSDAVQRRVMQLRERARSLESQ